MTRKSFERWGCIVSEKAADLAANPLAQIGFIVFCVAWFYAGWPPDMLTAALSILAITLTQMVLNKQNGREAEDRRRDIALHAKIDELVKASAAARDELAGAEELDEGEIARLRDAPAGQ